MITGFYPLLGERWGSGHDDGSFNFRLISQRTANSLSCRSSHVTGKALRAEPITEGDDLFAAKEQNAAMATFYDLRSIQRFTLQERPIVRADLHDFIACPSLRLPLQARRLQKIEPFSFEIC
jgi:hypothetical protein